MSSWKKLIKSFHHAFEGLVETAKTEQNFQLEILIAFFVVLLMEILELSVAEKSILILCICGVMVMEIINTAIEKFLNLLIKRHHRTVKVIKDSMAAAVLVSSIGAVIIAIIIFAPYLKAIM